MAGGSNCGNDLDVFHTCGGEAVGNKVRGFLDILLPFWERADAGNSDESKKFV
jgi:hypothetical protein